MIPPVDTQSLTEVQAHAEAAYTSLFPGSHPLWLGTVFCDVGWLFAGRHPEYGPIDLRYHDLQHTLQAVVCLADLLVGRARAGAEPRLDARQFELALIAALLHDTGYLKARSDTDGTGAKYTFCHVIRSCAFAASYVPTIGADDYETGAVINAINCTGPTQISRLDFRRPVEQMLGCALASADFVSQMADRDYPDKLAILFNEFHESDEFLHVPPARRLFKSADDLIRKTPAFWEKLVHPKLENEFGGLYRFLAVPGEGGRNYYVEAVEENIRKIKQRIAAADVARV